MVKQLAVGSGVIVILGCIWYSLTQPIFTEEVSMFTFILACNDQECVLSKDVPAPDLSIVEISMSSYRAYPIHWQGNISEEIGGNSKFYAFGSFDLHNDEFNSAHYSGKWAAYDFESTPYSFSAEYYLNSNTERVCILKGTSSDGLITFETRYKCTKTSGCSLIQSKQINRYNIFDYFG